MRKMALMALAATFAADPSDAALTITFQDLAGSLFETVSGMFDLTGLKVGPATSTDQSVGVNIFPGSVSQVTFSQPGGVQNFDGLAKGTIPTYKGFQGGATKYVFGDYFAFAPLDGKIAFSSSYQSNLQVAASAQYTTKTLADLGLSPGRYIFEAPHDVIYFNIGDSDEPAIRFSLNNVAQAPEPATWSMMIAGFGAIGTAMRRRKVAVSFA